MRAANSHSCAERSWLTVNSSESFRHAQRLFRQRADVVSVFTWHLIDIDADGGPNQVASGLLVPNTATLMYSFGMVLRQGGTFDVEVRNDGINVGNTPFLIQVNPGPATAENSIVVLLAPVPPASEGGTQSGQTAAVVAIVERCGDVFGWFRVRRVPHGWGDARVHPGGTRRP